MSVVSRWVAMTVVVAALAVGCTPSTPEPDPPGPPTPSPTRTVTEANLLTVADIPRPQGDGTIRSYDKNARPLNSVSVCQQDLDQLGATSTAYAAFKQFGGIAPKEGSKDPLANEPDVYALALQLPSAQAAIQARETYKSWVDTCRPALSAGPALESVDRGFGWTGIEVPQGEATIAEIAYRPRGSRSDENYWESIGLTVVEDRLMITVFVFYALEDLYGLEPENDESGYPHPQLQLVMRASARLTS